MTNFLQILAHLVIACLASASNNEDYMSQCYEDACVTHEYYDPGDNYCPAPHDRSVLTNNEYNVTWGDPGRAYKTIPPTLKLAPSTIPGAGLGIFTNTFIRKYTWLGGYDGEVVSFQRIRNNYHYAWIIHIFELEAYNIDAADISTSSYLRWVNCARNSKEQNVAHFQCKGRIYYMADRDVAPGQELFVFYGPVYAQELGIDMKTYYRS